MDAKVSTKTKTFQNLNKNCPSLSIVLGGKAVLLHKGFQPIVHHRTAKLGSQICSTRPRPRRYHESCKVKKIPSKYYWLAGKHMNKVLRWAFMMYHRVDDRALFFFWVPCSVAYLLGGCAALNGNQYFEGVVLF